MAPRVIDLSLDFDFFVRQDPAHPFSDGQDERGGVYAARHVWWGRYTTWPRDLYAQADLNAADCRPPALWQALLDAGVIVEPELEGHAEAGESHADAYGFFLQRWAKRPGPPDLLLHIDAHSDVGGTASDDLDCANWLWQLQRERPQPTPALWLRPKWLDVPTGEEYDQLARAHIGTVPFAHLASMGLQGARLRHVYLARSPVWVPPHLDPAALALAEGIQSAYRGRFAWVEGHPWKARRYPVLAGTELYVEERRLDRPAPVVEHPATDLPGSILPGAARGIQNIEQHRSGQGVTWP